MRRRSSMGGALLLYHLTAWSSCSASIGVTSSPRGALEAIFFSLARRNSPKRQDCSLTTAYKTQIALVDYNLRHRKQWAPTRSHYYPNERRETDQKQSNKLNVARTMPKFRIFSTKNQKHELSEPGKQHRMVLRKTWVSEKFGPISKSRPLK